MTFLMNFRPKETAITIPRTGRATGRMPAIRLVQSDAIVVTAVVMAVVIDSIAFSPFVRIIYAIT